MRSCLVLVVLSACELTPAPKPAPPPPRAQVVIEAPPAPPPKIVADAGVDAFVPSDECIAVGMHSAAVAFAETTDPAQKAALEPQRATIASQLATTCTLDNWSPELRKCLLAATKSRAMKACEKKLLPQPPAPPPKAEPSIIEAPRGAKPIEPTVITPNAAAPKAPKIRDPKVPRTPLAPKAGSAAPALRE